MNFRYIQDFTTFQNMFTEIFKKNGLDEYINGYIIEKFAQLTEIMLEINANMNITALTTLDKIIPLHYADCVFAASHIPVGSQVVDIGCGGGFPILPLAIIRPDLNLVGVDSTEKKVRYVQLAANQLELCNVETIAARAEDLGKDTNFRETFDVAISRAVARLHILDELVLPLVRPDGTFIAMKGALGHEEALEAKRGTVILGAESHRETFYQLHTFDEAEERTIIVFNKNRPTPPAYPRSFGAIKKKPL